MVGTAVTVEAVVPEPIAVETVGRESAAPEPAAAGSAGKQTVVPEAVTEGKETVEAGQAPATPEQPAAQPTAR